MKFFLEDEERISKDPSKINEKKHIFGNFLKGKNHYHKQVFYCERQLKNQKKMLVKEIKPNTLFIHENS